MGNPQKGKVQVDGKVVDQGTNSWRHFFGIESYLLREARENQSELMLDTC